MYTVKVHETIIKPHQLPLKPMVHGILPQLDDQKKNLASLELHFRLDQLHLGGEVHPKDVTLDMTNTYSYMHNISWYIRTYHNIVRYIKLNMP